MLLIVSPLFPTTMTKNCATCKKANNSNTKKCVFVSCTVHMHFEPSCRGLSEVAANCIMGLGRLAVLLCNICVSNHERYNSMRCQLIEGMNEKLEAAAQLFNYCLQKLETRLTACLDRIKEKAIEAT